MPRPLLGVLLLLLVSVAEMRAQGEVVLRINGDAIGRSEFEYYYKKCQLKTANAYLPAFIDYKLKVKYAKDNGLDTLSAFRMQLAYYQSKLLRSYLIDAEKENREARLIYERNKQRLQTNDWVQIAHISKYLPQNAGRVAEQAAKQQMDSIHSALQAGADFSQLALRYSDDIESRKLGGVLPWMPVNKNMQEWVDKLAALEKDKISVPFYSPLGIHIVKWMDRKPFATYEDKYGELIDVIENEGVNNPSVDKESLSLLKDKSFYVKYPELELRLREIHDGLLTAYLTKKYQGAEKTFQEEDLDRFFRQHKSDYAWQLPHYKGAVIHCKDKKMASAIKKYLKKLPVTNWKSALEKLTGGSPLTQAKMEAGLFSIGQNKFIDKLVFKCGSFDSDPDLPYTFVMGKKLKKGPENYQDVREKVVHDYQLTNEDGWMKEVKRKYKVEINEEVLKTVNNDGSN